MNRSSLFMVYAIICIVSLFFFLFFVRRLVRKWKHYHTVIENTAGMIKKTALFLGIAISNLLLLALPLAGGIVALLLVQGYSIW